MSLFKYVLSTMGVSKESISKFLKLWNWHIWSDLQNGIVQAACNSKFRKRNLQWQTH